MKIAIINITGGGISEGYKKYLLNIIPRMSIHHEVETILCVAPESINMEDWLIPSQNVYFAKCKPFKLLTYGTDTQLRYHLEKFEPDVILVPTGYKFCFKKIPVVNMIQNMEPFITNIYGNPLGEMLKTCLQGIIIKNGIKKANGVIAISKFVQDFIVGYWKIPKERTSLIYHGINIEEKLNGQKPKVLPKEWYGKFIFTAGSIRPARGLDDLLLAMKPLLLWEKEPINLVIAGESGYRMTRYQKKLKYWIQKNNLSKNIYWVGSLNGNEMKWCYRNCSAFIMTSRVEACPNIALEAISYGCIVIAADNPPLPEIFKKSAIFYPPKDDKALAGVIKNVLTWDSAQRKLMFEKAIERAADFSWDECAKRTVAVLAKTLRKDI